MIHRHFASFIAVGVTAGLFAAMDANISLFLSDKLLVTNRRLRKEFEGQNIWLIGASSGIGESLALQLSSSGASLVLSARNSKNLQRVAQECQQCHPANHSPLVVPLDMSCSQEELEATVDRVLTETKQQLDCVVFNAGIGQQSPAIDTSPETNNKLFQMNALSIMNLSSIILRKSNWQSRKRGHFVVTSSIAAKSAVPLSVSYAASKHAIQGYMQSLKAELPWLDVTLPCPGPVATNFHPTTSTRQDDELKMPVSRCARLILSSMMLKRGETWIAQQPTLMFLYLNQFFPSLAQQVINKIGPMRVDMWKEGYNIYSPADMRRYRRHQHKQQVGG